MDTENNNGTKVEVCAMCEHKHGENSTCECGCPGEKIEKSTCAMCGHKHEKEDGTCDCGCGMK